MSVKEISEQKTVSDQDIDSEYATSRGSAEPEMILTDRDMIFKNRKSVRKVNFAIGREPQRP